MHLVKMLLFISILTGVLFWPVFLQNKIPFNANLIASFFNPWAQEKFANWEGGIPNKPVGKDDVWIFYPQRTFTNSLIKKGEIPFWNPYSFTGNYHLGLSETGVFYPLNFLFLILPQIHVWTILILLEFIIAGFGMYLFLKRILRYEKSATLGALAFVFSGIVIVRSIEGLSVGHTLIYLPYVFWGIEAFFQTRKLRFLWVILLALSFSLLAGWFQYTFYIFIFSLLYAFFKVRTKVIARGPVTSEQSHLLSPLAKLFGLVLNRPASLIEVRHQTLLKTLKSKHAEFQLLRKWITPRTTPRSPRLVPLDTLGTPDTRDTFSYLVFLPFLILPFLTLFHTVPAFQTLLESPRSALEGSVFSFTHLMPAPHIFTLVFPDFWGNPAVYNYFGKSEYKESMVFIGVVPFIFSLISIIGKKKESIFFSVAIFISFLLAFDNPISRLFVSSSLPVFSSFLPNRIFLVSTFSFSVLAALGLDYILKEKKEETKRIVGKSFILLSLFVIILVFYIGFEILRNNQLLDKQIIQIRNSIIPFGFMFLTTVALFVFRNKYKEKIFFMILIGVLFLQAYLFAHKFIPFSHRQFLYPEHPVFRYISQNQGFDRFMSIGYGHIVPSIPLQFSLYSPEGIGSMYIRRFGEFVRFMKLGDLGIADKIAFDQEIYPKDVFYPKDGRLHRFYELASVKYIVSDKRAISESDVFPDKNIFPLVWKNDKWQIFENKKSMPRFFVTSKFKVISNDRKSLNYLFGRDFVPNEIVLEENPGFESKSYKGNVEIITYSPNKIVAKVNAKNDSLFYLSDNYSKNFAVFIDGKEGKLLRANYTFRAIPFVKGKHLIEMKYDDRQFVLGIRVAIITLLILGALTYILRKYV